MLVHPSELASLIGAVLSLAGVLLTVIQFLRKSGRFNLTLAATLPGLSFAPPRLPDCRSLHTPESSAPRLPVGHKLCLLLP